MAGDGGLGHHLEFQEIGEQDGLVAFTATPAEAQGTAKHVAGRAATFSNQALATLATLVQRVRHQRAALPQLGPQPLLIDTGRVGMAQSEGELAMSW